MGHQRPGGIPKTQKWDAVVARLLDGSGLAREDIGEIAALTLDAAGPALEKAVDDLGLRHTFFLLTQIALASRQDDWQIRLAEAGINITNDASIFDLTAGLQLAIDDYVSEHGRATDISEMAQRAAGEALASLAADNSVTLFGSGGAELQSAIRGLSTSKGFSDLGQMFFGRFTMRFLNFYLSRITARELGTERVPNVAEVSRFNDTLRTHCEQSARITRDFCGQWYSKTEYMEGIDRHNAARFMAIALRKLSRELAKQRAEL